MNIYQYALATYPSDAERARTQSGGDRLAGLINREFATDLPKSVSLSGSWAKGTAIVGGSDLDLFISITSSTSATLRELYDELYSWSALRRLAPREQNVSIGIAWEGLKVDLVPARRQQQWGNDHSLHVRRRRTWTKTNVAEHIALVRDSGRTSEIRLMKLWRKARRLDITSFLLELAVLDALRGKPNDALESNVQSALAYLSVCLDSARLLDPANSNNVVSDDLSSSERRAVVLAATQDLTHACGGNWDRVFR